MDKNLFYTSKNLRLSGSLSQGRLHLEMQVLINFVNTKNLPNTYLFLKKHFPSVLKTECFNEDNLNFEKEVRSTEIGHLFEHIFIDVLCFEKIKFGFNEAVFNGRTFWNWKRDAFGKFHIYVDIKNEDGIFLGGAFTKTIGLLEQILESNKFFSTDKNFLPVEID